MISSCTLDGKCIRSYRETGSIGFNGLSFSADGRRLIVKDSDWRWPQRDLSGNAIDFCVRVLGLSFHDAMREITRS